MLSLPLLIPWFKLEAIEIVGPIKIQPFGVLVATGILLGVQIAHARARKTGVDAKLLDDFISHSIITGFVFGHIFDTVLYYPELLVEKPWELLMPWKGLSSFGGFFGAVLGGFIFKKRRGENLLPYLDACGFGFPLAWAFGRSGCFVVHDHPGKVSDFFLAVDDYHWGPEPFMPRHDLGLYEVIWSLACVATFYVLQKKPRPAGFFIGLLAVLYAPVRFSLDFLRVNDAVYIMGLTPGHFSSVVSLALGLAVMRFAYKNWDPEAAAKAASG